MSVATNHLIEGLDPAFPVPGLNNLPNGDFIYPSGGMNLRSYFAAKAMQGLLACDATYKDKADPKALTRDAVAHADALIKALR